MGLAQAVGRGLRQHGAEALEDRPQRGRWRCAAAGTRPSAASRRTRGADTGCRSRSSARGRPRTARGANVALRSCASQHVQDQRDGAVLPAVAAPPRQRHAADAGVPDPARVLLERRRPCARRTARASARSASRGRAAGGGRGSPSARKPAARRTRGSTRRGSAARGRGRGSAGRRGPAAPPGRRRSAEGPPRGAAPAARPRRRNSRRERAPAMGLC